MTYAEYEENLTRGLLELDSITTRGSDIVRDSRKTLVTFINSELSIIDSKKPEIQESVKLEEQIRLENEKMTEQEDEYNSDNEYDDCDDIEMDYEYEDDEYDECEYDDSMETKEDLINQLNILNKEQKDLNTEKIALDQLYDNWKRRMDQVEEEKMEIEKQLEIYN